MREMQLRERCETAPGVCRCGSQQAPIVDTMYDDLLGRVYLCDTCARRVAVAIGFTSPENVQAIIEKAEETLETVASLRTQLEEALAPENRVVPLADVLKAIQEPVEA